MPNLLCARAVSGPLVMLSKIRLADSVWTEMPVRILPRKRPLHDSPKPLRRICPSFQVRVNPLDRGNASSRQERCDPIACPISVHCAKSLNCQHSNGHARWHAIHMDFAGSICL